MIIIIRSINKAKSKSTSKFYLNTKDVMVMLKTSLVMTAGTAFLLWLADQITTKGVGNGISMIIMAGIVFNAIQLVTNAAQRGVGNTKITMKTNMASNTINIFLWFILTFIMKNKFFLKHKSICIITYISIIFSR